LSLARLAAACLLLFATAACVVREGGEPQPLVEPAQEEEEGGLPAAPLLAEAAPW